MDAEIENMLKMHVIEKYVHQVGEVISPVFLARKADGSYRMILNLKKFNEAVEYEHFKMENVSSATQMMTKGCYMASVRHALYSVSIKPETRNVLEFQWRNQLYEYTCFANGLCNCPRYFTKRMKSVYAKLRSEFLLSASFIDDCYLQADNLMSVSRTRQRPCSFLSRWESWFIQKNMCSNHVQKRPEVIGVLAFV